MTTLEIAKVFRESHPKACDFPIAEYDRDRAVMDTIAEAHGYRFRGVRSGRAVFSSKPPRSG